MLLTVSLTTDAFIMAIAVKAKIIKQKTMPTQTGIADIAIVNPATISIITVPTKLMEIKGKL